MVSALLIGAAVLALLGLQVPGTLGVVCTCISCGLLGCAGCADVLLRRWGIE